MRPINKLTVEVLVDNTTDMLSSRPAHVDSELQVLMEAGLTELAGESLCCALHGLSLVVTAEADGEQHTMLFDAGPDSYGVERNGKLMGVNFGAIEAIVLSHGHYDHAGGLPAALRLIREANGGAAIPMHVHPEAFAVRGIKTVEGNTFPSQPVPDISELEAAGAKVVLTNEASEVCEDYFYVSGEIPRVTFEEGYRNHYRKTGEGEWVEDPDVIDERYMVVNVRGKGLVVFTGCSHAGIVNILTDVANRFPNIPIYGVIGGLHLSAINEDRIPQTIDAMREFNPQMLIVGHCTGWRATQKLVNAFGEEVVDPLAVGTRHRVEA